MGALINTLLSFFTTPILTRIIDPASSGKLTIFNTRVGILTSLFYFGLNEALLRFFYSYEKEEDKRKLLKLCFLFPVVILLTVFFVSLIFFINGFIITDYSMFFFILLFLCIFFTIWERMSNELLQNEMNSSTYSWASIVKKAVYCIGTIVLIPKYKNNQFFFLAVLTTVSVMASALIGTVATRKYWRFNNIGYPENKTEIFRYSLPMYVYFAFYSLFDSADKLFIERFCTDYEIGIYGTAFSLVGVYSVLQTAFIAIWRPVQTKHYTENPNDITFIQKGNRYITILMFFLGINTIMFKDIICMLLGPSYRPGAMLIPFLIFNPIMNTMIWTVTSGIEISKKSYLNVLIIVISLAVLSVGSLYLIPSLGTKGSAISVAASLIVQYYLTLFFSNRNRYVDYGTIKMTLVLILMLLFAYYSTFFSLGYLTVILYVLCLSVFTTLYFNDIKDMLSFLWESINNRKKS
ncbi:MAG: lipopolysaccharide biosynthesis protein [Erysipelotrichaceae bacterium]|nr:lipopolysaccharide biosynthesis protein [Erysipelotrichaceae bacterium]